MGDFEPKWVIFKPDGLCVPPNGRRPAEWATRRMGDVQKKHKFLFGMQFQAKTLGFKLQGRKKTIVHEAATNIVVLVNLIAPF